MALNARLLYLIAYDIRCPRRLGQVHRFLRREGLPVQYSVFTAQMTQRKFMRVLDGLDSLIDPRADDIRLYPLPSRQDSVALGRQIFPEDVMLISNGINLVVQ